MELKREGNSTLPRGSEVITPSEGTFNRGDVKGEAGKTSLSEISGTFDEIWEEIEKTNEKIENAISFRKRPVEQVKIGKEVVSVSSVNVTSDSDWEVIRDHSMCIRISGNLGELWETRKLLYEAYGKQLTNMEEQLLKNKKVSLKEWRSSIRSYMKHLANYVDDLKEENRKIADYCSNNYEKQLKNIYDKRVNFNYQVIKDLIKDGQAKILPDPDASEWFSVQNENEINSDHKYDFTENGEPLKGIIENIRENRRELMQGGEILQLTKRCIEWFSLLDRQENYYCDKLKSVVERVEKEYIDKMRKSAHFGRFIDDCGKVKTDHLAEMIKSVAQEFHGFFSTNDEGKRKISEELLNAFILINAIESTEIVINCKSNFTRILCEVYQNFDKIGKGANLQMEHTTGEDVNSEHIHAALSSLDIVREKDISQRDSNEKRDTLEKKMQDFLSTYKKFFRLGDYTTKNEFFADLNNQEKKIGAIQLCLKKRRDTIIEYIESLQWIETIKKVLSFLPDKNYERFIDIKEGESAMPLSGRDDDEKAPGLCATDTASSLFVGNLDQMKIDLDGYYQDFLDNTRKPHELFAGTSNSLKIGKIRDQSFEIVKKAMSLARLTYRHQDFLDDVNITTHVAEDLKKKTKNAKISPFAVQKYMHRYKTEEKYAKESLNRQLKENKEKGSKLLGEFSKFWKKEETFCNRVKMTPQADLGDIFPEFHEVNGKFGYFKHAIERIKKNIEEITSGSGD